MTRIMTVRERCAVCEAINVHPMLQSTNSFSSDLDGRPIGMARGTLHLWVHQCQKCGYCASALEELLPGVKQTVNSEPFQQLQASHQYPDLAKKFLGLSLIQENAGQFYQAGYSALCAAWACDDQKQLGVAKNCRQYAIRLFLKSRSLGYQDCTAIPYKDNGTNEIILADMLRRTGQFEEAREIIEQGRLKAASEQIAQQLDYQRRLVEKQDVARHPADENFASFKFKPGERQGCILQLISVASCPALMAYLAFRYPESVGWIICGGIILVLLIPFFYERLSKIIVVKKPETAR